MKSQTEQNLVKLFESWSGEKSISISCLPQSGSDRKYYRITGKNKAALGVFNPDAKENKAFVTFTRHFFSKGLNVPEVYGKDADKNIYLIQDLGDVTLFSRINQIKEDDYLIDIYKKVIDELPKFQIVAGKELDYSVCYPRGSFDKQSMMWDLSYFKYYFLKLAKIPFDEQGLENDFQVFTDYLLQTDCNYFLYRDFQSRNIMIHHDKPYFIDYQGGRKGALQYDIASLLFDAKANIPQHVRDTLLEYYIQTINKYITVKKDEFIEYFYGYVLIRIMQAMGAYGFRGFYEKKEHFLQSIPYAIENLKWLLNVISLPIKTPTLTDVLHRLTLSENLKNLHKTKSRLQVTIYSFAYKKGIPLDESGNGGGFVFDCRAIPNPGKHKAYEHLTGKDKEVIEFLEKESEMTQFLSNVYAMVDLSVNKYLARDFNSLMVSFGCTGGQHRSVYCAEMLAKHLKEKYNVEIILHHREQETVNLTV